MRKNFSASRPQAALLLPRAAFGAALLSAAGCGGITANSPEAAQMRFVQASPDTPAVDMYLDTNGAAYNLSFGTVTSYVALSPGEYHVSAHRGGTTQALVTGQVSLGASRGYTAVLSNTLGNLQETIFPDAVSAAPSGTVAVRVINAAALEGPVDVFFVPPGGSLATTSPAVRELSSGVAAGYEHLSAEKTYTVQLVPAGITPRKAAGPGNITVGGASGAVRTVIIADSPARGSRGLTAFVLDDFDTP